MVEKIVACVTLQLQTYPLNSYYCCPSGAVLPQMTCDASKSDQDVCGCTVTDGKVFVWHGALNQEGTRTVVYDQCL